MEARWNFTVGKSILVPHYWIHSKILNPTVCTTSNHQRLRRLVLIFYFFILLSRPNDSFIFRNIATSTVQIGSTEWANQSYDRALILRTRLEMNVGTAWSVINNDTETSSPIPEALWYEELTSENGEGAKAKPPGFFVSLLQRWDMASDAADSKYVFYQVSPFPSQSPANPETKGGPDSRQFRIRLPRQLAVFDELVAGSQDADDSGSEPRSTYSAPVSPRMQKRRIPLLVRFTANQKVLFMQFSPTYVRIALAIPDSESDANPNSSCKHWTIELKSCVKDPYIPVPSHPEALPKIRIPSSRRSKSMQLETILPGGLFWLNQSYGNARGNDYQEFFLAMVTTKSLLCYTVTLNMLNKRKPALTVKLSHTFAHPEAIAAWWAPKLLVLVVGSIHPEKQQLFLKSYFFGENGPFTSRRDALRNPLLLPIRLERPPPVPGTAFAVCQPALRYKRDQSEESKDMSPASPLLQAERYKAYLVPPVAVVQLYGRAFIVEIGNQSQSGESSLILTLHELDRENFSVNIGKIQV